MNYRVALLPFCLLSLLLTPTGLLAQNTYLQQYSEIEEIDPSPFIDKDKWGRELSLQLNDLLSLSRENRAFESGAICLIASDDLTSKEQEALSVFEVIIDRARFFCSYE